MTIKKWGHASVKLRPRTYTGKYKLVITHTHTGDETNTYKQTKSNTRIL